jgi:hypothetical protein
MDTSQKILSDIIIYMKYAKYLPDKKRRENWNEIVTRNMEMHMKKFPNLSEEIFENYQLVYDKKVLPSMRSMQFAGKPIEISPNRIYNCAYLPIDDWRAFSEIMFLLLGGSGVGVSVQYHHVEKLPEIKKPKHDKTKRFLISDSIEGWADAIKALMKSYFYGGYNIRFDFSDIRPKGAILITTGGRAPGSQPLKECLLKIDGILNSKEDGDQLAPIEVHDIICYIADAVLAGGIRRAALISLFSATDNDMLSAKTGNWWELNPQRGRANNSVVLMRHRQDKQIFDDIWTKVKLGKSGEPGLLFSNDKDWGVNPCIVGSTKVLTNKGFIEIQKLARIYKKDDIKIITQDVTGALASSELEWCGITEKNDKIHRINFENGAFQLVNLKHKFYLGNHSQIEVSEIVDKLKTGEEVVVKGYNKLIKILDVDDLNYNEDVYDLTANPNYNFFAKYDCNETFSDIKIKINDEYYYPFDVIESNNGKCFIKDLKIGDELL